VVGRSPCNLSGEGDARVTGCGVIDRVVLEVFAAALIIVHRLIARVISIHQNLSSPHLSPMPGSYLKAVLEPIGYYPILVATPEARRQAHQREVFLAESAKFLPSAAA
jgi:hypothetical protein